MRYAQLGTVSEGTLRIEALIAAFAYELEYHLKRNQGMRLPHKQLTMLINTARRIKYFETERASEILEELSRALGLFARPYCYFGIHEGDGADFGFWPYIDAIEELPRISDPNELDQYKGQDCRFVNDHGNVTVFDGKGRPVLELV